MLDMFLIRSNEESVWGANVVGEAGQLVATVTGSTIQTKYCTIRHVSEKGAKLESVLFYTIYLLNKVFDK